MNTCETCRPQLLNLVYGLLTEDEQRACEEHLSACSACREALAKARHEQMLMGEAAKMAFSAVRFTTPSIPMAESARVLPRPRKPFPGGRFAMAASLLLVVGGGIIGYLGWQERHQQLAAAQDRLALAQQTLTQFQAQSQNNQNRIRKEIQTAHQQLNRLNAEWDKQADEVQRSIQKNKVQVLITGPKNLQPGAKNAYKIEMRSQDPSLPPMGNLSVGIVNPKSKEVLFKKDIPNRGNVEIELPANLPLKPGADLAMEVRGELDGGVPVTVSEPMPLVAPLYLTHLTTDRPMYRPGEVVHFRSLTLERFSLKPAKEDFNIQFRITAPNGGEIFQAGGPALVTLAKGGLPIKGPDGQPLRGLAASQFKLPADLAGGEYALHVTEGNNRFQPEKRKFIVNRYQAPRLNKELEFTRKSYGPGDDVDVQAKAVRVEGGQAGVMRVIATAQVDGQNVYNAQLATDTLGAVKVRFPLPKNIDKGQASLALQFSDGGNTETIVRPIPIVLKKLFVDFYPEGGDLVAGLANRVYFRAQSTLNKPAELHGRIVDGNGKTVAQVETLNDDQEAGVNQGMGVFQFTPQAGQKYELKIDAPIGIESRHWLPETRADGVALNIPKGVVEDRIDVVLGNAGKDRRLMVGAYCRGRLIDNSSTLEVKKGETIKIKLKTAKGASGVYRVTVFENPQGAAEDQLLPVAERLIYRRPLEKIDIRLSADKKVYAPGDKVKVALRSNREDQALTPAIVVVSVVDLSVLKLADEKTARSMPAHFYLTTEIQKPEELEYADFIVSEHPKAPLALDLLLGTQGWRRFAEQNPASFVKQHRNEAQRLLALNGQDAAPQRDGRRLAIERVDRDFAAKCIAVERDLAGKEQEQQAIIAQLQKELPGRQGQVQISQNTVHQATSELNDYQAIVARWAIGVAVAMVLIAGFVCLCIGLIRIGGQRPAVGYLATGVSLILLVVVAGLGGAFFFVRVQHGREAAFRDVPQAAIAEKHAAFARGAAKMPMADMKGAPEKKKAAAEMKKDAPPLPPAAAPVPAEFENRAKDLEKLDVDAVRGKGVPVAKRMAKVRELEELRRPAAMLILDEAIRAEQLQLRQPGPGKLAEAREFRQMDRLEQLGRNRRALLLAQARIEPFLVREYAHRHRPSADMVRRDFTETLYWHPVLVLADGSGEISFDLSDATTRFQVLAMGHTLDGRLGTSTLEFASRLPFSVEPKVPMEVSSSDKVIIPVTITNDTEHKRTALIETAAKGLDITSKSSDHLDVEGNARKRYLFHYRPTVVEGQATLSFTGKFLPTGIDRVERSFAIVPDGFPVMKSQSDMLEGIARQDITLPESWVKGTLKVQVQAFPSTLADLQKGLEAMLREPGGCFEQSSSSNYPNVLILNYLKESEQNLPEVEKRARQLLANGYQRLTSFECIASAAPAKKRGYEWFGQTAPPHEALTAYGLLQFKDMAKVHAVDKDMVERTRTYLLGQRDGKGGFKRNTRALDTFGRAPDEITNAYIVWAMTEAGDDDLQTELTALIKIAKDSKDPYFLALVGNALVNRNQTKDGLEILTRLVELQKKEGHLEGTRTSITGSQGRDLQVETTALSILAWLKANRPEFTTPVQKAVKWLGTQRGGHGGFGATQSTILALKALIAHTRTSRSPVESGELKLYVNDAKEPVAVKAFVAKSQEPLVVSVPREELLNPGKNTVRVEITGKNAFPYTLSWSYRTVKPVNPENCPVHLTTKLDRSEVKEGETVRLKAIVENKSGKGQGMAVAILGIPAGLSLPEDFAQLKEMARLLENGTKQGKISFFEVRGRELVLYWRDLAPEQKIEVDIDLICRIPGEYRGPASRAYLYYNADFKFWTDPVAVAIRPAE